MRRVVCSLLLCSSLIASATYAAPPTVRVSPRLSSSGTSLSVTITPSSSAASCDHTLFAASARRSLSGRFSGARQLGTQSGASTPTVFTARNLKQMKRSSPRSTRSEVFFRSKITCDSESGFSRVVRLSVRTRASGLTSSRWIRQLPARLLVGNSELVEAFPNINFSLPTDLQNAGDNRLFVSELSGKIWVFQNSPSVSTKSEFLDISSLVESGGERGLLGFAFHPEYATNGYAFVHYSKVGTGDTVIARYTRRSNDANSLDPASAFIVLETTQPLSNHNGGQIAFGPDGFLYIALGDGGGAGDPFGNGQNRASLLGKILRINVDAPSSGRNYSIPSTNPFFGNASGYREEIFAYGLRNPWRMSFDSGSGRLFAGDVGQGEYEEINLVESGKNYGWNTMEGNECYQPATGCDKSGLTLPVAVYAHEGGSRSVTGGYVYRGSDLPGLVGLYLYADFITGQIWGLSYAASGSSTVYPLFDTDLLVSSFGVDKDGELFILSYGNGKIWKIEN